jgi:Leucine-rich repeat (LRR) protein
LEYLPDELFCVGSERLVTHINLRRNALRIRPSCGGKVEYLFDDGQKMFLFQTMPAIGWLDDIVRLQSLRYLNIADNHLGSMPSCLMQLNALTELNISGNRLQHLPTHIRLLTK